MGKDQELLAAARTGDVDVIEKLCNQRLKRSGPLLAPLQSLRRTANQNCQDSNGDTPLHLAALNGHCEAVKMLLRFEASANISDTKGCYPLHLAAWNGNAEICHVLLTQGPSIAKVNEQNHEGETALLCASQYGHTQVVSVLLEYHADPTVRDIRNQSPLDLACQYGRLESVQQLLRKQPYLLDDLVEEWSPLHLAARNGHKQVVEALYEAGCDINRKTESGSALHECALFGKYDVVKLLLNYGVNVSIIDAEKRTALEVLSDHHSQISQVIGKLILDYIEGNVNPFDSPLRSQESLDTVVPHRHSKPARDSDSQRDSIKSASSSQSSLLSARPQKPERHKSPRRNGSKESVGSGNSSVYDVPYCGAPQRLSDPTPRVTSGPVPIPKLSKGSSTWDREASPSPGSSSPGVLSTGSYRSSPTLKSQQTKQESQTPTPKKPPRRKTNNMVKSSDSFRKQREPLANQNPAESPLSHLVGQGHLGQVQGQTLTENMKVTLNANAEPKTGGHEAATTEFSNSPRISRSHEAATTKFSNSPIISRRDSSDQRNENHVMPICDVEYPAVVAMETENNNEVSKMDNEQFLRRRDNHAHDKTVTQETIKVKGQETIKVKDPSVPPGSIRPDSVISEKSTCSSRPPSLEIGSRRSSLGLPLSPTGYEQPPTPDFPPPSPMTAIQGIQEQINPNEKRRSRDMETITELQFLTQLAGGSTIQTVEHSTSTDTTDGATACAATVDRSSMVVRRKEKTISKMEDSGIEVFTNGNNPYFGLTKGSLPQGQRRVKSQIYDSLLVHPLAKHKKRISAPGIYVNFDPAKFDPLMESEEKDQGANTAEAVKARRRVQMERTSKIDGHRLSSTGGATEKRLSQASPVIDENEEWAQIADIMASIGGGMGARNSLNLQEIEDGLASMLSAGDKKIESLVDWLDSLGLAQYENTLVAHGFDHLDFMGPNVMEESDLGEIGITNTDHVKTLLETSSKISPLKPIVETGTPESVEAWLASLNLKQYLDTFHRHGFHSLDRVKNIWEMELSRVLDDILLGHRKRILASLRVPPDADSTPETTPKHTGKKEFVDFTKKVTLNWSYPLHPDEKEFENLNLYKDYTNISRRHGVYSHHDDNHHDNRVGEGEDENGQGGSQDDLDEELSIRPPQDLAQEESPAKQWRHRPEVLIKGCCNYNCMYLGSTLVKNLHGTESTKDSIHKLKKSTESISKVPIIILSISFRGVKFIDGKSKKVICEHEISNIFCACQDGENLNYFAYITKDLQYDRHYCHVFSVKSTELATEIILTLGEAFEVAYQVAMRERGLGDGSLDEYEDILPSPGQPLDGATGCRDTEV